MDKIQTMDYEDQYDLRAHVDNGFECVITDYCVFQHFICSVFFGVCLAHHVL